MDQPAALLALIADLYAQVHEASARALRAEQELAARDAAEVGSSDAGTPAS